MLCHDNLKLLEDYGVDRVYALTCRRKYLTKRLWQIEDDVEQAVKDCTQCPETDQDGWQWAFAFLISTVHDLWDEKKRVKAELDQIRKLLFRQETGLSEEMIEAARRFPVDRLVEFTRGKATAWCHEDRNPSLYHGTRRNVAVCPVCNRTFNPIDILMDRDGLSFAEAVKALQ